MVISAASDPQYNSSRLLLRAYADTALTAGWILVAADPAAEVSVARDGVALRYALNKAALAVLDLQRPGATKASLAFGGFSGGAKYTGWLAAAFAIDGRTVMGIYLAGVNQNTIVSAAQQFKVLNDTYRRIPIFLQSGEKDEISTPADHLNVYDELKRVGFKNIRIEYFPGRHDVDPGPLRKALDWFRDLAPEAAAPR
jgi:predicted esterase